MGQKTHPIGFRLGIVKDWQAKWFAAKQQAYRGLVFEDIRIRREIAGDYPDAGVSRVDIERGNNDVIVTIHTARPGIVIGRGGQRVDDLRKRLEKISERRVRLNVQEIRQPEMDAYLVARNVADQLERRIAFRRAIRQTLGRTMQAGAQGIKIICSGRLGGADIARSEKAMEGRVPLHTLRADIDYGLAEAGTEFGRIGVKVWIYRGDILPDAPPDAGQEDDLPSIEVTLSGSEPEAAPGGASPAAVQRGSAPAPRIVQPPRQQGQGPRQQGQPRQQQGPRQGQPRQQQGPRQGQPRQQQGPRQQGQPRQQQPRQQQRPPRQQGPPQQQGPPPQQPRR